MPRPKPTTKMHLLGVRVEKSIWRKLERIAAPETVSTLIRKILRDYVAKNDVK